MTFKQYQEQAKETAKYPNVGNNINYPLIGVAGECGELLNKYQKYLRGDKIDLHKELPGELGDIIWFIATIANELGIDLNQIAEENLKKLDNRMKRNKIHGSGDSR